MQNRIKALFIFLPLFSLFFTSCSTKREEKVLELISAKLKPKEFFLKRISLSTTGAGTESVLEIELTNPEVLKGGQDPQMIGPYVTSVIADNFTVEELKEYDAIKISLHAWGKDLEWKYKSDKLKSASGLLKRTTRFLEELGHRDFKIIKPYVDEKLLTDSLLNMADSSMYVFKTPLTVKPEIEITGCYPVYLEAEKLDVLSVLGTVKKNKEICFFEINFNSVNKKVIGINLYSR